MRVAEAETQKQDSEAKLAAEQVAVQMALHEVSSNAKSYESSSSKNQVEGVGQQQYGSEQIQQAANTTLQADKKEIITAEELYNYCTMLCYFL